MNYIDEIADKIMREAEFGSWWDIQTDDTKRLYRLYALLALTVGTEVTLENVHDAWAAWRSDNFPEHRSIVPFDDLSPEVQELDREYADAIKTVAARIGVN